MESQKNSALITAAYERLSADDEQQGESNSILNQKTIIEKYALKNGLHNIRHFQDDGVSGVHFERPGWKQLLNEVEAGNVATVICKDLSRIGRNYLMVGYYTEMLFKNKGVRFIAISNRIDSAVDGSDEYAPFINLMSEWHSRDTSRKLKTAYQVKNSGGLPTTNRAIYGYRKSPDNKNKWIIDDEAAAVVRRIFQMFLDGIGLTGIAKILTEEKIDKPSRYFAKHLPGRTLAGRIIPERLCWNDTTVVTILDKPEYAGHTVNFRSFNNSYKDKQRRDKPKDEWQIIQNTHEAIVSQETFDAVQRRRLENKRIFVSHGAPNPLSGILFCADCGAVMHNARQPKPFPFQRNGKVYMHKGADSYTCSTYELTRETDQKKCTKHFIRTSVVEGLILDTIRNVSGYVRENEAEFVEKIRAASGDMQKEAAAALKKQYAQNQKRIGELDSLFCKVYEDSAAGRLSERRFEQLSNEYEREQADIEEQNSRLRQSLGAYETDCVKADKFIEIVRRASEFNELTPEILHEFIEKVAIYEGDKDNGKRVQQVDIFLRFIGRFDL